MAVIKKDYYDSESPKSKDSEPTLLSKSVLRGKDVEVGDRIILKVTAVHDDQIAVAYADKSSEPEDETKPEADAEDMAEAAPPTPESAPPQGADLYS